MARCEGPRARHGDAAATAEEYLDYIGSKVALFAHSLIGHKRVHSTVRYSAYPVVRREPEMVSSPMLTR